VTPLRGRVIELRNPAHSFSSHRSCESGDPAISVPCPWVPRLRSCNPITNLAPSFSLSVIPAKAGTQRFQSLAPLFVPGAGSGSPLSRRFRGDDGLSCPQDFLTASFRGDDELPRPQDF